MSEQQADYDTNNTQPTPGPWRLPEAGDFLVFQNRGLIIAELDEFDEPVVVGEVNEVFNKDTDLPGHYEANARLIAAAGTAASKLSEEYDPVAVVEALPSLITVLQSVERANATKKEELIMAQNHAKRLLDTLRTDATASEATASDTTQTDD